MTEKDLLAVLDLPEEEKPKRLYELGYLREYIKLSKMSGGIRSYVIVAESVEDAQFYTWNISLADLAFRLRDEAVDKCAAWRGAKHLVYSHTMGEYAQPDSPFFHSNCQGWFTDYAGPIDYIIAALIALKVKK